MAGTFRYLDRHLTVIADLPERLLMSKELADDLAAHPEIGERAGLRIEGDRIGIVATDGIAWYRCLRHEDDGTLLFGREEG